jgi:hypothetical protein
MTTPKTELLQVKEAAAKYKIPEREIRDLIEAGRLDLYTADDDQTELIAKEAIGALAAARFVRRENFGHLEGAPIGISEAALKYRFHVGTISQWVEDGHIREIGPDPRHKQRRLINEADVAYAAALRDLKGIKPGRSLWE